MKPSEELLEIARVNFETAQANLAKDLAGAKTSVEAREVLTVRDDALATYLSLIDDVLDANDADWDVLLEDVRAAAREMTNATTEAKKRADRLRKIARVTGAVTKVIDAVKG